MNLLFVHQHLGEFGGAEANLHLTASELARRGHHVSLAYERATGRGESPWRTTFGEPFPLDAARPVESAEAMLEACSPDLVYLHTIENLELIEALLRSRVPVVRMVHDHTLYCMRGYKYNYLTRQICTRPASGFCVFPCLATIGRNREGALPVRWNSYAKKHREIRLNQQCDHMIVYSDYSKAELVRNGFDPAKIDICVPLKLSAESTPVSSFSPENVILFAGQIIRGKGVDVLLEALSLVQAPFRCLILGDGNHRPRCQRICRRLGLEGRVEFKGYVLPAEMRAYYLEASVFVMSSLWPEPFGLSGPEAMRYGLPVVAFDAGAIREWLHDGQNGFLAPWGDTRTFARRLDELLSHKDRARAMGARARASVEQYDSVRQINRLEQVFLNLVHEGQFTIPQSARSETILSAYE